MKNQSYDSSISEEQTVLKEILRYLSFWPYMMLSLLISIILTFTYLRYQNNLYQTTATIEIIDKAQDSEMSLPTAMTVFNRSMINLENEIGVLRSFSLHQNVVKKGRHLHCNHLFPNQT